MAPQQILSEVRRSPFAPFKLVLADGAKYDIRHPDQCMVMSRDVVIGEITDPRNPVIGYTIKVNCWNVVGVERTAESACA